MKKMLLPLLAALCCGTQVLAQDVAAPMPDAADLEGIRFGAFVAPNVSYMRPTASKDDRGEYNVSSQGSKIGFTYGLMAEYFFAPNYGLVSGIQINSTGGKMLSDRIDKTTVSNGAVRRADFDYRLQFLEVPLALKLRSDDLGGVHIFGQLGISGGILIGKKADYDVEYWDGNGAVKTASGDKIKLKGSGVGPVTPVMFQMNLGAGVEIPFSSNLSGYAGIFFNNGFAPDATLPQNLDGNLLGYGSGNFRDGNTRLNNFALRLGIFF